MPTLEHQQAVVVEILRRARGDAVSFDALRDAGVEFPASVVAELELAGIPLQRCTVGAERGRRASGVHLDPRWDVGSGERPREHGAHAAPVRPAPAGPPTEAMAPGWNDEPPPRVGDLPAREPVRPRFPPPPARRVRDRRRSPVPPPAPATTAIAAARDTFARARVPLPVAALAVTCVAVAVLTASVLAGGAHSGAAANGRLTAKRPPASRHSTHHAAAAGHAPSTASSAHDAGAASASSAVGASAPTSATESSTRPAPPSSSTSPDRHSGDGAHGGGAEAGAGGESAHGAAPTQLAETLEARGHALLESGRYATAATVLNRALAATGESLRNCTRPSSGTCLTYAYALYDLGRALQLGGDPAAAVPVLSQRLQIDNQRATVMRALALARAQADTGGTVSPERHD